MLEELYRIKRERKVIEKANYLINKFKEQILNKEKINKIHFKR